MDSDKRAEFLKDEYVMLQQFYEDIDTKGLTIKNWAVTVGLATIGAGFLYNNDWLFLIAAITAVVFWYLEAYWRGLSHFFAVRIMEIEGIFASGKFDKTIPLQVYSKWDEEFKKSGDQTMNYMRKFAPSMPQAYIAAISLTIFVFRLYGLLK